MRFRLSILIFVVAINTSAQSPVFNQVNFSKDYAFNSIIQDDYGFLWLGCTSGLLFYNGYEDYLLEPDLITGPVLSIQQHNDTLYAGSDNGYLYLVDLKMRKVIDSIVLNIESKISAVVVRSDELFIATYGDGLYVYNKQTQNISPLSLDLSSRHIYEMVELGKSEQIAIASDRGIDLYNTSTGEIQTIENLPDIIITNLVFESPDLLWASSYDKSIFSVNLDNHQIQDYPFDRSQKVNEFIIHKGKKLACTSTGVIYLDQDNIWRNYLGQDNISEYSATMVDQENNIWIVGKENPLWKASLYFNVLHDVDVKDIQALGFNNNELLIGHISGLSCLNLAKKSMKMILDKNITCISVYNKTAAIGTFSNGIYFLNEHNQKIGSIQVKDGLIDDSILDLCFLDNNTLLVSSLSGTMQIGLDHRPHQVSANRFSSLHDSLGYSYIMDIYSAKDAVFLGKDKAGFSTIKDDDLISFRFLNDNKTKLGSINSIAESEDGSMWLSSSRLGLLNYESDSLRQIKTIQLDDEAYTSIIPVDRNNLLLIRASSIDLFDVEKEHIMYFNEEAGLIPKEAFINNFAYGENEVWFVHHDKIYSFQPPSDHQKIHPTTSLDLIEVNLRPISPMHNCFRQSENNFKFNFTGGWLTDPSKLSYAYYLEGFDEQWRETKDRSVSYPHLPPGDYVFHVKAAENKYFSDEPISSYTFKIHQSFYNSAWFYFIILVLSGLLIRFLILRDQREKELKSLFQQKQIETKLINLKAQLNPHFLFNSFNTLSGLIEIDPDRGISYIENITDFYRYILDLGDKILIPLSKEMELVTLYEQLLKERFGDGFAVSVSLTNNAVLIPPMTIQMLIENAIKHNQLSKKRPLNVSINQNEQYIIITNNKAPKNMTVPGTGLGLRNIQDRYRLLGFDDVIIKDSKTTFSVYLPNYKKINNESSNS